MQEAQHCGGQPPDRTCDEDILVTFGFTVCISKPFDTTRLPWVLLCTMLVSLVAAYTVAIVCLVTTHDRSCCPENNRTTAVPLRETQMAELVGGNDTIQCNRTAGQCGRGPGTWYCAVWPEDEQCSISTSNPTTDRPPPMTSTPTTTVPSTPTPTTAMTTTTPPTWCRCPTPVSGPEQTSEEPFKLTFKVEREVDGSRRVETIVGNEIFLDAKTEVELEMEGCDHVKTDIMKYDEMSISIDEH